MDLHFTSPWTNSIYIAVFFFVIGQILLKKAVKNNNFITTAIVFGAAIGIMSIICYTALSTIKGNNNYPLLFSTKPFIYSLAAGILFFFGNLFWIHSISSNQPLGNVRVVMAGVESFTLFLVGFIIFNESITYNQLLGTGLILTGIHMFTSK
jgi:multidrug transporter EmrE-like cation transporter